MQNLEVLSKGGSNINVSSFTPIGELPHTKSPKRQTLIVGTVKEAIPLSPNRESTPKLLLDKYPIKDARDVPNALDIFLGLREANKKKLGKNPETNGQWQEFYPDEKGHKGRTKEKITAGNARILFNNEDPEKPIGAVAWSYHGDPALYPPRLLKDAAVYISQRMVHPDYHNKGIGDALFEYVYQLAEAHGATYIRSEIFDESFELQKKYREQGRYYIAEDTRVDTWHHSPAATLMQKDIASAQVEVPESPDLPRLPQILTARNPFMLVPDITPSVLSKWRIGNYSEFYFPGFSAEHEGLWLEPFWKNQESRNEYSIPLTRYMTLEDEIKPLIRKIGLAAFLGDTHPLGFDAFGRQIPQDETRLRFAAIERPIETMNAFDRAWFGFETWQHFEGNGPLLRGTVNKKGNLLLADSSCFYLSDCEMTSKKHSEVLNSQDAGILFQPYELQSGDTVQVRLRLPTVRHGQVARMHAIVLKMDEM